MKIFFEADFPLEKIKENKVLNCYESIDEIIQELSPLINEAKVKLEENENTIEIIFELPLKKFQKVPFKVVEKKKSQGEKIIELYNIAIKQNKEIKNLKNIITNLNKNIDDLKNILNNEIENLRNTKENIENENKKNLMEKKTFEEKVIFNSNSNIFESLDEIKFIINQLETHQKVKNRKIFFNLLYRATRDGKRAYDFHNKCDGIVQQLVFIKTVKGEAFGGYFNWL